MANSMSVIDGQTFNNIDDWFYSRTIVNILPANNVMWDLQAKKEAQASNALKVT